MMSLETQVDMSKVTLLTLWEFPIPIDMFQLDVFTNRKGTMPHHSVFSMEAQKSAGYKGPITAIEFFGTNDYWIDAFNLGSVLSALLLRGRHARDIYTLIKQVWSASYTGHDVRNIELPLYEIENTIDAMLTGDFRPQQYNAVVRRREKVGEYTLPEIAPR